VVRKISILITVLLFCVSCNASIGISKREWYIGGIQFYSLTMRNAGTFGEWNRFHKSTSQMIFATKLSTSQTVTKLAEVTNKLGYTVEFKDGILSTNYKPLNCDERFIRTLCTGHRCSIEEENASY
jgi:hypothetical protein